MRVHKKVHSESTTLALAPQDGAFVFRHGGGGLELYVPTSSDAVGPASEETRAALVLAWIVSTPAVRDEMERRFRAFCAKAARRAPEGGTRGDSH